MKKGILGYEGMGTHPRPNIRKITLKVARISKRLLSRWSDYQRDYYQGDPNIGEITLKVTRISERLLSRWSNYHRDYSQGDPIVRDITLNVARLSERLLSMWSTIGLLLRWPDYRRYYSQMTRLLERRLLSRWFDYRITLKVAQLLKRLLMFGYNYIFLMHYLLYI